VVWVRTFNIAESLEELRHREWLEVAEQVGESETEEETKIDIEVEEVNNNDTEHYA
jgi:hypothetical protein